MFISDFRVAPLRAISLERQQRVVVKGEASNWLTITSGVSQGSLLGPLFS